MTAPDAVSNWGIDEVERWMLDSELDDRAEIAEALREEEVDGAALLMFEDKHDVKRGLGITLGKAGRVWQAVQELQQVEDNVEGQHGGVAVLPPPPAAQLRGKPGRKRSKTPVLADEAGKVYVKTFAEAHPEYAPGEREKYFKNLRRSRPIGARTIGICVPMYNEPKWGLDNTLNSLFNLKVPPGFTLDVIILMDGLNPIHESTRKYLSWLYGVDWDTFDETMEQTTIFESLKWYDPLFGKKKSANAKRGFSFFGSESPELAFGGPAEERPRREDFRVSCLIKKKNYRKHNSHQWFMAAFGKELEVEYLLCTDCSTVFDKEMLLKLTDHLEKNASTSAVCGRQRVMSVQFQNAGSGKPLTGEFLNAPGEYALRQIQTYDFEADHPVSKAVYDFLGFLPVLPGPCGLYRYADLKNGRYEEYFKTVNKESADCGLWLANLKIAEDRIPSLFAVFFTGRQPQPETLSFKTHWVRDAVFYFESEETLKSLVLQRRRWLNGTNAGYIYIAQNLREFVWKSRHSFFMKLFTTLMITIQIIQIAVLSLGPGIFSLILFGSVQYLMLHKCSLSIPEKQAQAHHTLDTAYSLSYVDKCTENPGLDDMEAFNAWLVQPPQLTALIVEGAYVLNYLIFLWVHRIQFVIDDQDRKQKKPGSDYVPWSFMLVAVFNSAVVIMFLWSLSFTAKSTFVNTWHEIEEVQPGGSRCIQPSVVESESGKWKEITEKACPKGGHGDDKPLSWQVLGGRHFCWQGNETKGDDVSFFQLDFTEGSFDVKVTWDNGATHHHDPTTCPKDKNGHQGYTLLQDQCKNQSSTCDGVYFGTQRTQGHDSCIEDYQLAATLGWADARDAPFVEYRQSDGDAMYASLKAGKFQVWRKMTSGECSYAAGKQDEDKVAAARTQRFPQDVVQVVHTRRLTSGCLDGRCWGDGWGPCDDDIAGGCSQAPGGGKGWECRKGVCSNIYKRCGKNSTLGLQSAIRTCTPSCSDDQDCDIEAGELCYNNLPEPVGCEAKLLENALIIGYVLVPLLFAIVDMPISKSMLSPLMMIRSAPWYILFMPTFVAFFSAYSTNRLADVSWGQRSVEGEVDPGQRRIESTATCIAWLAMLTNVTFAVGMTLVKLYYPSVIEWVAIGVMSVAGCTFGISAISYMYHYYLGVYNFFFADRTGGTGLGFTTDRAFKQSESQEHISADTASWAASLTSSIGNFLGSLGLTQSRGNNLNTQSLDASLLAPVMETNSDGSSIDSPAGGMNGRWSRSAPAAGRPIGGAE